MNYTVFKKCINILYQIKYKPRKIILFLKYFFLVCVTMIIGLTIILCYPSIYKQVDEYLHN